MGLFDFFKKKIKDADMCLLRDLLVVAFTNDGPTLQPKTRSIIADMVSYMDPNKYLKALSLNPDTIADVFPSDYKEKKNYLFKLFYVWKYSGNYSKRDSLKYIQKVSKKMKISDKDYNYTYDFIRNNDLSKGF